MPRILLMQKEY